MKRIFYTLFFLIAAVSTLLLRCSGTNVAGGGTIETTNGIVGSVRNNDDTPAANSIVKLFPDDYDPVEGNALGVDFVDTADANGTYRFSRIASGRYTVVGRNRAAATSFLKSDIMVHDDSVTTVPAGILNTSGSIVADFSSSGVASDGYVYIPGTDISSPIENDGSAFLADVPAGTIPSVMLASDGNEKRNVLRDEISVESGDTLTVPLPLWKYARCLALNTTASGAGVTGDVYDFPVLIRLNDGNFDFTQARADGGDLVFTGDDDAVLPREIERWDAAGGAAEIWVKVDTVHGNDSLQSIIMYWGNASADGSSNGAGVFDTANGFAGVWHLGDSGKPAVFRNSTENANNGIDSAKLSDRTGIIGNGQAFRRADSTRKGDKIVVPSATSRLKPQQVTLSAWIKPTAVDDSSSDIVSMGDNYLLRIDNSGHAVFLLYWGNGLNSVWCRDTLHDLRDGQWHYLAGTYDGAQLQLRVDGALRRTVPYTGGIPYSQGSDLVIGGHGTYKPEFDFTGFIDEVNIASTVRSPDWILLCYRNQTADDVFVRLE